MPTADSARDDATDGVVGRVARSGAWLMLAHAATAGSAFAVSVVVARRLGAADFGRYSYFFFLVTLIPTAVALGVPPSIARVLPERLGAGDPASAFGLFRVALRIHAKVLVPAVVVAAGLSLRSDGGQWLTAAILVTGTVGLLLGLDYEALLTALRRFRVLSYVALGTAVAQVVAVAGGSLVGVGWRGYLGLQTAALVGGVVPVALIGRRAMSEVPAVDLADEHRRAFTSYARQQVLRVVVTQVLWGRPEVLFLEVTRTDTEVGFYNVALRLASIAAMLPLISSRSLIPEFAFLRGSKGEGTLTRTYPRVCVLLVVLTAPMALGGAALAGPLIDLTYGPEYSPAATAVRILLAGSLVNALAGPASAAALTGHRPRTATEIGLATAAVNLALGAVLIPRYGPVAAAAVNVAAQTAAVVAGLAYAHLRLGLRYPVAGAAAVVAQAAVAAAAAWALQRVVGGAVGTVLGVVAAAAVYAALLAATGTLGPAEMRRLFRPGPPSEGPAQP